MYSVTINNVYMHEKGKIILFPTAQEASSFVNAFFQYSMNRMMQENPMRTMDVLAAQNAVCIEAYNGVGAETVEFKDLKK